MIKLLIFGFYDDMFSNRKCFNTRDSSIHENCYDRMIELEKAFNNNGFQLVTLEEIKKSNDIKNIKGLICIDHPSLIDKFKKYFDLNIPKILIAEEIDFINRNNYKESTYSLYDAVFTWDLSKIDNKKIYHYYSLFPDISTFRNNHDLFIPVEQKRGKVLVASNRNQINDSFYHYRKQLVEWYVDNASDDFTLYGRYWNRTIFESDGLLNRVKNSRLLDYWYTNTKSRINTVYEGLLISKYKNLNKFKFNFCIENYDGRAGYMTEKLWDSLIAGVIPVYYPSDTEFVSSMVPDNIYINMKNFKTFKDLDAYLNSLPLSTCENLLNDSKSFLNNLPQDLKRGEQAKKVAKKFSEIFSSYK